MKKRINKIFKSIKKGSNKLVKFLDKKIIMPITRFFLKIKDFFTGNSKLLEQVFQKRNTIIFLSLVIAIIYSFSIDSLSNNMVQKTAEVLYNQPVTLIYNDESYVVEGAPETVDITLIGKSSDLFLARQLPNHEVTIDLTNLKEGTHKVPIKYTQYMNSVEYKLDPSYATVVISKKTTTSKTVNLDILNEDSFDSKLVLESITPSHDTVFIKSSAKKLDEVAIVKALVNLDNISEKVGTYDIEVPLVAYDKLGNILDVEIVPSKITTKIVVSSPSKEVPINIIPVGDVTFGYGIKSITSNVNTVTVYGTTAALENIKSIDVEVDVTDLKENKSFTIELKKPAGTRDISVKNVKVDITLDKETSKEIEGINIDALNLSDNLIVKAADASSTNVTVIIKGVESVLNEIEKSTIKATINLEGYTPGEYEVDILVTGTDKRVKYLPKTKKTKIIIQEK